MMRFASRIRMTDDAECGWITGVPPVTASSRPGCSFGKGRRDARLPHSRDGCDPLHCRARARSSSRARSCRLIAEIV